MTDDPDVLLKRCIALSSAKTAEIFGFWVVFLAVAQDSDFCVPYFAVKLQQLGSVISTSSIHPLS